MCLCTEFTFYGNIVDSFCWFLDGLCHKDKKNKGNFSFDLRWYNTLKSFNTSFGGGLLAIEQLCIVQWIT